MPVRLITDERESDGLVEIYLNDAWGPICDIFWTINDANIVCRQLGHAGEHFLSAYACKHHVYVCGYTIQSNSCISHTCVSAIAAVALDTIVGLSGGHPVMAYTDCSGTEHQFGTCVGFSYPPYVPPLYCSNSTLAGVKCFGNVELYLHVHVCTYKSPAN